MFPLLSSMIKHYRYHNHRRLLLFDTCFVNIEHVPKQLKINVFVGRTFVLKQQSYFQITTFSVFAGIDQVRKTFFQLFIGVVPIIELQCSEFQHFYYLNRKHLFDKLFNFCPTGKYAFEKYIVNISVQNLNFFSIVKPQLFNANIRFLFWFCKNYFKKIVL